MIDIVEEAFSQGEILIASRDEELDRFLSQIRKPLPWEASNLEKSGAIALSKNWIYPVLTSVSGNKSDRLLERLYTSETKILPNCQYENTVTFSHTHGFRKESKKEIEDYLDLIGVNDPKEREKMLFIQGNGPNKTFLRIFVPPGSLLSPSSS